MTDLQDPLIDPPLPRGRSAWARDLVHPLPLLAVLVLVINDHVLKGSGLLPGALTGKLSDIAGLFFFPLLLASIYRGLFGERRPSTAPVGWSVALTAIFFAALKTSPTFNAWVSVFWGPHQLDPTDTLAIAASGLAWAWARHRASAPRVESRQNLLWQVVVVCVASFASFATSAPRMTRQYPAWQLTAPSMRPLSCAQAEVWVKQSGKEGVGIIVAAQSAGAPSCIATLVGARFIVGERVFSAASIAPLSRNPVALSPSPRAQGMGGLIGLAELTHVTFVFDNEMLWNNDERDGRFELMFEVNGQPAPAWTVDAKHVLDDFHKVVK